MMPADDLPPAQADNRRSEEETLAVLGDPDLMAAIREADADVAAGRTIRLSKQEALAELYRHD